MTVLGRLAVILGMSLAATGQTQPGDCGGL